MSAEPEMLDPEKSQRAVAKRHGNGGKVISMTPMEMLADAIGRGASIDILEKLMALQERWERNLARKAFDAAIAEAGADIKPIARNRTGHNSKKYADFSAIATMVDPILSKHGLRYRFNTKQADGQIHVTCVLTHRDGHHEETTLSGPADTSGNKNAIQSIGSTLTYLQRYSLVQMLGLAAADDDDGNAAGAGGPVNDEQAEKLTKLIMDTGSDLNIFLKRFKAESISDFPAAKYFEAVGMLETKRQSKGAKQ
jgi:hypothetical protein